MVLPYYSFRIKFKDTYFYKAFWSFAVRLSRNFAELSVKGENPTMVLEYFQINSGQILVFRNPLTSTGNLPFSQNLSQVAGREETMESLILLNMCYYSPPFIKLWIFPLNSGFLLVSKRRNSPLFFQNSVYIPLYKNSPAHLLF